MSGFFRSSLLCNHLFLHFRPPALTSRVKKPLLCHILWLTMIANWKGLRAFIAPNAQLIEVGCGLRFGIEMRTYIGLYMNAQDQILVQPPIELAKDSSMPHQRLLEF